ncbi:hypothetical protein A2U01_0096518, partial [Trifolium medium]|nr:hypothetical protein [Trifolium medium]
CLGAKASFLLRFARRAASAGTARGVTLFC